jgi:hypothetical protein
MISLVLSNFLLLNHLIIDAQKSRNEAFTSKFKKNAEYQGKEITPISTGKMVGDIQV